jgi:citrate lyase subunit gamma (acyl carrier protein)
MLERATAGTVESSDIYIELLPLPAGSGIELSLTSVVYAQFGEEIEGVIRDTLEKLGVKDAKIIASDRGAVDCTIRARVETAVGRMRGGEQA